MNNLAVNTDVMERIQSPMSTATILPVIRGMLDAFHKSNIIYCHWKSNEHLGASMLGDTDLDILFDEQCQESIQRILNDFGFKKFVSIAEKQYRDIEDFIGLDKRAGKIVHVHAHFKLTLGESHLKGYQLSVERQILESRLFDMEFGIYRIAPAFEMILLYFRFALKIRNRDILRFYFKRHAGYSKNILREYTWLRSRCTNEEIRVLLASLFPNYVGIHNLVINEFSFRVLLNLSRLLHKQFRSQRLYSPVKAKLLRWYREIYIKVARKVERFSNLPILSQRVHPQDGFVVALVGADGSGKSTIVQDLKTTFKKKIDVYDVYMGRGRSGQKSWQRKILKYFKNSYLKRKQPTTKTTGQHINSYARTSFKSTLFRSLEALTVARERRKKLRLIQAAKKKGMLVICDRYPQNQLMGYNDGPVLSNLLRCPNLLFRFLARREAKVYQIAEENPPDIVFKLIADAALIALRKSGRASLETLELKIEGVRRLEFSKNCNVVTIDAGRPFADVVRSVKSDLWSAWG